MNLEEYSECQSVTHSVTRSEHCHHCRPSPIVKSFYVGSPFGTSKNPLFLRKGERESVRSRMADHQADRRSTRTLPN